MKPILSMTALLVLLVTTPVFADDITGADQLLCASVQAIECFSDGNCHPGSPVSWDAPRFVRLDFAEKMLRTTKASGEDRSTPMKHIEREGGRIFIQGVESGRAFSIILDEASGTTSTAIALEGHVLAIFGHCTPIEAND